MKAYEELTFRGRNLRLRKLCIKALEGYPIDVARIRYLTTESTTMFRVDAVDGSKYVFRIYSEDGSSLAENQTEMFWLEALAHDTDLRIIQPVARQDGEYLSFISLEGIPGEKRCALYKWVPGVPLKNYVSVKTYRQLGVIMAGLHNHAEGLSLPGQIHPKRWDKTFYFPDEKAVYNTSECSHIYTPEEICILDRACACANSFLADIYKNNGTPFVIHGDLHFWNIHIHRGNLYVLDFEDMVMGFPEQDISICLYYLRNEANYAELASAFQAGYAAVRQWPNLPQRELHALWLARMTNFANYAAEAFDDQDAAREYISARCIELDNFLAELT